MRPLGIDTILNQDEQDKLLKQNNTIIPVE